MILSDFLTLESYFAHDESALFFEDIAQKYGTRPAQHAIAAGELVCKQIMIGPDSGRVLLFLSDKGRKKAKAVI